MKNLFILMIILALISGCSKEETLTYQKDKSVITIQINLGVNNTGLQKPKDMAAIAAVRVIVFADDMARITRLLTLSGTTASGTIEVTKGAERTFVIECLDADDNMLLRGETTTDIQRDVETVQVMVEWLASELNISVPLPTRNINVVQLTIGGDGLNNPINRDLNIIGDPPDQAVGSFPLPRGEKEFQILAAVNTPQAFYPLFRGVHLGNLISDNATVTVPIDLLNPVTDFDQALNWHDHAYEDAWAPPVNDIFAAGFDITDMGPVYLKSIRFEHIDWQGGSGDYQVIILDDLATNPNVDHRFLSGPINPLDFPHPNNQKHWDILWDPPEAGVFSGVILAGLLFLSDTGLPLIGYDMSNPSESSWWYQRSQSDWFFMNDGDFAITLIVQTPGGQQLEVKPEPVAIAGLKKISASIE